MRKRVKFLTALAISAAISISAPGAALAQTTSDFKTVFDTLTVRANEHFGIKSLIRLKKVMKRGNTVDFYFTPAFSDYAWHSADMAWFRENMEREIKNAGIHCNTGELFCGSVKIAELCTPVRGNGGRPSGSVFMTKDPRGPRVVREIGRKEFRKGMSGRHIALWQSHGRYFNEDQGIWKWQRATVHRTVEDMYTQSYVLPFLIPMLENAGAYVMTPRERDTQVLEIICDNDPAFKGERDELMRQKGQYREKGQWKDAGTGFADALEEYRFSDNPFTMGSARMAECSQKASASARWIPKFAERGNYAVYVSYKTLPESTTAARYSVHHLGGTTAFDVDQTRGGGTWIYLGTFEFDEGDKAWVELDNRGAKGKAVTADAVKIGGGMGKVTRGGMTSGMPSYAEGASYWMQWAGVDSTIRAWDSDYTNDYATRGAWTEMMKEEKGIPFDLSLAFHTDAGMTPDDGIIGTLSIYTLKCDGKRKFKDGSDRMSCRMLSEYVQDQIVEDVREDWEPQWNRRMLWDRSYSESRTTGVPAVLLELLSHQNFADMKYGLDPGFRFTVCRAVYKGMLKFLSEMYGCSYAVQPLPVHGFAVRFGSDGKAALRWEPTEDPKEPTAVATSYMVYTRVDDGAFDRGREVKGTSVELPIENGHIYSYRVVAVGEGGYSFPSETLAIGAPSESAEKVLVVNNFTRVAAPAWIDTPQYAGFDGRIDSGVPYINEINYIGENYEFRRNLKWETDDNPGHGACFSDRAGEIIAGNTFDYPYVHGVSLMELGYAFCSMSSCAFQEYASEPGDYCAMDLICGKQVKTMSGSGRVPLRFEVFPESMREALRAWTSGGGNIIISGSDIATDAWDQVYPFDISAEEMEPVQTFIREVLGYKHSSSFATSSGKLGKYSFHNTLNSECYSIEAPDGISPASIKGNIWMRYAGSGVPGAVRFNGSGYRVVSLGVPIECFKAEDDRTEILEKSLKFITKQ